MHGRTTIAAAVVGVMALAGCAMPAGSGTANRPSPADSSTALDARLTRCAALGANAAADTDCQSAWTEARRRILPVPSEK
jgi:conjugative transfer region protein TrbK